MDISEIKAGLVIKCSGGPEPMEVKKIEQSGEYVHIICSTINF